MGAPSGPLAATAGSMVPGALLLVGFINAVRSVGATTGGNSSTTVFPTAALSLMRWRGETPFQSSVYSIARDGDTGCAVRGLVQVSSFEECKGAMQGYVSNCGCAFGDTLGVSRPSYSGTPGCSLHWPQQRGTGKWSFSSNPNGQGLADYTPVCKLPAGVANSTLHCYLLGNVRPTGSAISSVFCPGAVNSILVLILVTTGCCLWVLVGISLGTNSRFQACVAHCCGCGDDDDEQSTEGELGVGVSMTSMAEGVLDEGGEVPTEDEGGERIISATEVWEPATLSNGRAYEVNRLTQETRWVGEG